MNELHLFIHGIIGEGNVTSAAISKKLATATGVTDIVLHIDSIGGDVDEGFRIFDLLRLSGKKISAYVTGNCYSAAMCILAAAAKGKRFALPSAKFMIHRAWTSPDFVNAEIALELATELNAIDKTYKGIVGKIIPIKTEEVQSLYDNETVFDSAKALQLGVISAIQGKASTEESAKAELPQYSREKILAAATYSKNRNMSKKPTNGKALGLIALALAKLSGVDIKKKAEGSEGGEGGSSEVKAASIGLADESGTVYYSGDSLAEGTAVFSDEGMTTALADGDYSLADGSTITVTGGLVTAVMSAMATITALRAENTTLRAEKDKAEGSVVQAKKDLESIRLLLQNDGGEGGSSGKKEDKTEKKDEEEEPAKGTYAHYVWSSKKQIRAQKK